MIKNIRKTLLIVFPLVFAVFVGLSLTDSVSAGHDRCEDEETYVTAIHDYRNEAVDIDFQNSDKKVEVHGRNGYVVDSVWLDIDRDGRGFIYYGNHSGTYDPSGDSKIESVKVKLVKYCPTPKPTVRPTSTPTHKPTREPDCSPTSTPFFTSTPTAIPTYIPTETPTPFVTQTPCVECVIESTSTPLVTESPTPNPDICANLDGVQLTLPDEYHFDNDKINCLKFELGGPSDPGGIGGTNVSVNIPQGQVLGASTMAETGVFEDSFFYSLFSVGSLLTSLGIIKRGKEFKK